MTKELDFIEKELDAKIPRSAVEERDGGGGRRLSYLSGHYVIDRLNKVFGPLGWSKEILEVKEVVNKTAKGEFPAYLVKLRLTAYSQTSSVIKEAYGYGCDKGSQNAHELAIKEAVTDALKVAAKDLGMSMGLALYSKEQENVDDGEPEKAVTTKSEKPKVVENPTTRPAVEKIVDSPSTPDPKDLDDKKRTLIRSFVGNAIKAGKLTMPEMKKYLQESHATDTLDGVVPEKLDQILEMVKNLTK